MTKSIFVELILNARAFARPAKFQLRTFKLYLCDNYAMIPYNVVQFDKPSLTRSLFRHPGTSRYRSLNFRSLLA